jgi:hypothetical protein
MDCGRAVSMARILAIRRAFGEAARGNRLNLDGEHGHGGERYGENEFLHVNLRSSATATTGIHHGGLGLYSIVARQTARCNASARHCGRLDKKPERKSPIAAFTATARTHGAT